MKLADLGFPLLAFFEPERMLSTLKLLGFNAVCGPEVENRSNLTPTALAGAEAAWIKGCAERGLAVILKNPPTPVPANCVAFMISVDEPNRLKKRATPDSEMVADFKRLRSIDPRMPIVLSLAGGELTSNNFNRRDELKWYEDYAAICDVFTTNRYWSNLNANRYVPTALADGVAKLRQFFPDKPVWAWCGMNDQQLDPPSTPPDINREPTPAEMELEVAAAIKAGATGIGWFATCQKGKYGWGAGQANFATRGDSYWPLVNRKGESIKPQIDKVGEINRRLNKTPAPPPPPPDPAVTIAALQKQLEEKNASVAAAAAALVVAWGDTSAAKAERDALGATLAAVVRALDAGKPTALISQPPLTGTGDPRLGILNAAPGNYVAPWISPYDYTEEHVRTYARAVKAGGAFQPLNPNGTPWDVPILLGKNAPTAFDNENYDDPNSLLIPPARRRPDLSKRDVAKIFRQHLDWFRAEAPDAPVGLDGVAHTDDFAVAHEGTTFVNGGGYLLAAEWLERDFKTIRDEAAMLRARYPGKPLYFWVNPRFTAERLPPWKPEDDPASGYRKNRGFVELSPEVAARYVALNREVADQIVTWSEVPFADVLRVLGPELLKGAK